MFTWDRNVISASIGDEHLLYMHDELGSPSRILDEMSDTVEMHNFDEFGNDLTVENELLSDNKAYQTNGSIQPFTYTGYQRDDITATYYAQAREYLPSTGRFTGEDIIKGNSAYPLTLNTYTYCWNRPMNFIDLNGMKPKKSDDFFEDTTIGNANPNLTYEEVKENPNAKEQLA